MIDSPFRKLLPRVTKPLIGIYATLRLTPSQVTLLGFTLAIVASVLTAAGWASAAIVVWWLGRLFDGTDGIYARATDQVTDFGGYLDIVADMAAYGAMIIGFAVWKPEFIFLWLLIMFLYVLCITSALALGAMEERRQLGVSDGRSLRLAAGLAEGGETGIAYTLMLLFAGAMFPLAVGWVAILSVTVIARTVLAARMKTK